MNRYIGLLYKNVFPTVKLRSETLSEVQPSYCVQEVADYISDGWLPNLCFKTAADAELSPFVQLALLSTIPNYHQRVFFITHCHWLPCKEPLGLLVQYGKHRRHRPHLHLTISYLTTLAYVYYILSTPRQSIPAL